MSTRRRYIWSINTGRGPIHTQSLIYWKTSPHLSSSICTFQKVPVRQEHPIIRVCVYISVPCSWLIDRSVLKLKIWDSPRTREPSHLVRVGSLWGRFNLFFSATPSSDLVSRLWGSHVGDMKQPCYSHFLPASASPSRLSVFLYVLHSGICCGVFNSTHAAADIS